MVAIDNLNDYYEVSLKQARLQNLIHRPGFEFEQMDIVDRQSIGEFFSTHRFQAVVNLAAQAGVRYSLENPQRLCGRQPCGVCKHTGRMSSLRGTAPDLCFQ